MYVLLGAFGFGMGFAAVANVGIADHRSRGAAVVLVLVWLAIAYFAGRRSGRGAGLAVAVASAASVAGAAASSAVQTGGQAVKLYVGGSHLHLEDEEHLPSDVLDRLSPNRPATLQPPVGQPPAVGPRLRVGAADGSPALPGGLLDPETLRLGEQREHFPLCPPGRLPVGVDGHPVGQGGPEGSSRSDVALDALTPARAPEADRETLNGSGWVLPS